MKNLTLSRNQLHDIHRQHMMDLNLVSAPKFVDGVDQNEHFEFGLIGWQWWADGLLAILRVWQQKVENYVQKEKSHGCAENVIEILS